MPDTSGQTQFPWRPGSATGIGSLPGGDPAEAMRLIFGELPDLPHLVELPGRGPGADMIGRTAGLLVGLPVEITPGGWRFAARPGRDVRRARGLLSSDLDALEEAAGGYQGPLKIQVCGPWTLAAGIELARSQDPALADHGALADLFASLAEGVRAHVDEVRRRVPGGQVLVQFDEPGLPAVLAGSVPSASGFTRMPAPAPAEAEAVLRDALSAAQAFTIVHCCGLSAPFGIIRRAGADAVSFDLSLLRARALDELGEAVEAGLGILAGVAPTAPAAARVAATAARSQPGASRRSGAAGPGQFPAARSVAEEVIEVWRQMGWPSSRRDAGPAGVPAQVVLTPTCGLAGATPDYARAALARCRDAGRMLPELIEESR